jgi:chromosomal replication initiator protein
MDVWDNILSQIKKRVSFQNFDIWFKPTVLQRQDQDSKTLFVHVPNTHFKYWLAENYSEVIQASMSELELNDFRVSFVSEDDSGEQTVNEQQLAASLREPCPDAALCRLNGKYTFNRFVVGFCNQFAHAAGVAVAEQPAKAYNPFFIYGGVGLGKTHLMHAIGHFIKAQAPQKRLMYMSSEHFMNELINAIRYDKIMQFREKCRNIDVLLMDDVQFLAGKERTQEEFFHTFNALYDSQKQIVMTSDCPPREIPTLEERLHSRFEWGLIADMQPPDVETKIAILRKKAEFENVNLPDDVAYFIATNVKSNVRELEGSLVRLGAYSRLTGRGITLPLAQEVLKSLTEDNIRVVSIEGIQKVVADYYSLKVAELKAKNNSRRVAEPRQMAMFLCRKLTDSSLPEIGKEFGGKHHTTVLHSIRKIEGLRKSDPKRSNIINKLISSVR